MSQHTIEQARNLEQAFSAFNQMSVQLESSYRDLEDKVSALNEELVSARHERLQQLAEKESLAERLERLLELLPGGVLVLDGHGLVTQTNPMAEALLEPELCGKYWADIMAVHFDHGQNGFSEVRLKSGKHVNLSRRTLDAEPGQIVLLMDVSDQYELKKTLNRQDRLATMGEMAASLAHQIRTPLSTALLYASNFRNDTLTVTDRERMSTKVVERLKHLEHMVNDMLRFTRGSSLVTSTVGLQGLLEEFRQIIEPQVDQLGGSLTLVDTRENLELQADSEALLGVFLSLAENSIQAAEETIQITVSLEHINDREVVLGFTDNGPGIENDIVEKIFTPFFTTRSTGTGLGLAVAQATMQAHHGELKYHNKDSRGACFEIVIPLADSQGLLPSGIGHINDHH